MTYQMQPSIHLRPAPSSESFCNSPNAPFNYSKDQITVWQQNSCMVDSGFSSGASTHAPPSVCGKEDIHVNETHHESIQPHFGHAYFEGHFNEEKNERHSFQSNYAHSLPESREENMKLFDDQLVSTQLANVQLSVPSSQVLSNASFCFSNQISIDFASQRVSELLMLLYDNDKVVVSKAAKMLHQVMKRDFSQDIIKVLPHMISTLIHTISFLNNLETVKCIAGILHSVSLHQPGLLAIYKANGIPALVNLLSSPMESILFYTVTTLHNLLLNQEGSKLSVCEAGGLQKLVTLLKHTNESFLSVVVDCLQTLAFRNPKNKLIILEYGGTEKLVHIMRTYKCQTLLWTVSRVLKALTVCCNNKPVIIKAGGMQALAMHLKNQSEKFVLNCLWSLRNLSDAAINERNVESLLNQLINLLGSNDKHIVTCSAGILSNLTCNNNCNKMIVCQAKGVEALVQAIVKAENNEEISEPAICTLRHLTSGHPEAPKIAVYCCSALPAIMKLLEPPSSWALIKAVIGFIRNLAVPPQNQMHLQNIGVIPKLMKLLRAAYQEIQKHHSNVMDKSRTTCIDGIKMEDIIKGTTYALQVLAKHMHNRAVMKELDIVTFLVQILNREKEYFQCAVAGILAELAVDPDAIQMIESSGAVLLLRNALNSTNDQLVEYATTILVHLAAIKPEKYTWLCADLVNALQKDEILTDMDLSITPDPSYQIMGSVNDFESKLNPSLLNLDVQNATVLQPSNLEMELDLQMDLNFESTFDILSPILLSPPQAGNPSKDIIAYLDSSLMHFS